MDLCADQLLAHFPNAIAAEEIAPPFRRVISRLPFAHRVGHNTDRVLNRHILLPRTVRRATGHVDFVHVVDHSYAHVALVCPAGRVGVYCHDLDAFRSLLDTRGEPRPWWFRRLARRTFDGLKRAAVVFHSTAAVGRQLREQARIPEDRLVHAPYGVAPEYSAQPQHVEVPVAVDVPFLLHVGGNIPRKRLDVLLGVFAAIRARNSKLHLVQVGGPWPSDRVQQIARLGIGRYVSQVRGLTRDQLAELYRRAAAVLVPSESEGFGLPVIEALACGAIVVASDIPVLREVGGDAVIHCPVGEVGAWVEAVERVVFDASSAPPLPERLACAARYSWVAHARTIADAYLRLAG